MEVLTTIDANLKLSSLAERINEEHQACERCLRDGLQHAINAGNLLIEAKGLCQHGTWTDWLRAHCAVSERTAQLYMRVARGLPLLEAKAQRVADLTLREAIALLAEPTHPDDDVLEAMYARVREMSAALEQATSLGEVLMLRDVASRLHREAVKTKTVERMSPGQRPAICFWAGALVWAEEHGIDGNALFAGLGAEVIT